MALAVYGGSRLSSFAFDDGIAKAAAARALDAARPRLGLPLRRDRLALGAVPGGRPGVLQAPPDARAFAERLDPRVHRGQPPLLASGSGLARVAACRGEGLGAPGRRVRELGQVALHVPPLLRGRRDRREPAHGLDGPVSGRHRRAGQPAPGPVARHRAPSRGRDREGAGRDARGGRPVRVRARRASRRIRSSRRSSRSRRTSARRTRSRPTPGSARPARSHARRTRLYQQLGSLRYGFKSPVVVSGFERSVPAPARRPRRDDRRRPAASGRVDHVAGPLRHARDAGSRARPPGSSSRPSRWSPSSATSSHAGSPTACSCTCGRSSAAAAPRTPRPGPTTAAPGSDS